MSFASLWRDLSWKALGVGLAVYLGLGILYAIPVGSLAGPDLEQTMHPRDLGGVVWLVGWEALVCVFAGLGGHAAARRAERRETLHGALVAVLGFAVLWALQLGAQAALPELRSADPSVTVSAVSNVLPMAAAMLGGWLVARRRRQAAVAT